MKNILIIAAHPDDEVLGCGGLIALESEKGNRCYVLFLTDGSGNRYDSEDKKKLLQNVQEANSTLGTFKVIHEAFPNQALDTVPVTTVAQCLERHISEIKPDEIYTHHSGDLNRDHQIVYEATMVACRPLPGQSVKNIYSYYAPSSTEWHFTEGEKPFIPNVFVDIECSIEKKNAAMHCYQTECKNYPHPRSLESLRVYANYWGVTVGIECAEPFKLIRSLRC